MSAGGAVAARGDSRGLRTLPNILHTSEGLNLPRTRRAAPGWVCGPHPSLTTSSDDIQGSQRKKRFPDLLRSREYTPRNTFEQRVTDLGQRGLGAGPTCCAHCETEDVGAAGTGQQRDWRMSPQAHPGASAEEEAGFRPRQRGQARGRRRGPEGARTLGASLGWASSFHIITSNQKPDLEVGKGTTTPGRGRAQGHSQRSQGGW